MSSSLAQSAAAGLDVLAKISLVVIAVVLILFYVYGAGPHKSGFDDQIYHASRVGGNRQRWYGSMRSDPGAESLPISGNECPTRHALGYGHNANLEAPGYSVNLAENVADLTASPVAGDSRDPHAYGFVAPGMDGMAEGYSNPYKSGAVSEQKLTNSLHGMA